MSYEKTELVLIIIGILLGAHVTVLIYEATMDYRDQIRDFTHSTWLSVRDWCIQMKFPQSVAVKIQMISAAYNPTTCVLRCNTKGFQGCQV